MTILEKLYFFDLFLFLHSCFFFWLFLFILLFFPPFPPFSLTISFPNLLLLFLLRINLGKILIDSKQDFSVTKLKVGWGCPEQM